jgi:hypothetical protein
VTTVRSASKAESIQKAYPQHSKDKLDFVFVKDIAAEGAFDEAVKTDPPFDAVVSTSTVSKSLSMFASTLMPEKKPDSHCIAIYLCRN